MAPFPQRVRLRTGHAAWIRPVLGLDAVELQRAFALLSEVSRYQRFLTGTPHLTDLQAAYFTAVDHFHHEAFVALPEERGTDIVGVARFVRYRADPSDADLAITVADEWQGRGLATILLQVLSRRARTVGVRRFTAEMLTDNAAVLALLRSAGLVEELSAHELTTGYVEL